MGWLDITEIKAGLGKGIANRLTALQGQGEVEIVQRL